MLPVGLRCLPQWHLCYSAKHPSPSQACQSPTVISQGKVTHRYAHWKCVYIQFKVHYLQHVQEMFI